MCLALWLDVVIKASAARRDAAAGRWEVGALRSAAVVYSLRAGCERTGAVEGPHRVLRRSSATTSWRSARINHGAGGSPDPQDDTQRCATGRTAGHERLWRLVWGQRHIVGGALPDQPADGRERDGTAGMEHAEMADFHEALG